MPYYVYILQSLKDHTYYKGSTERSPFDRLMEHNAGLSSYTSAKIPWKLVYVEEPPNKNQMLIREKKLKRGNDKYFRYLIDSKNNLLNR